MHVKIPNTSPANALATSGGSNTPTNLSVALSYADAGIPVYWVSSAKRPYLPGGYKTATTDREKIIAWAMQYPAGLAAIPTGPASGVWVLDVDGPAGRKSLNSLLAELSLEQIADLSDVIIRTPGGGLHLYFKVRPGEAPRCRAGDIGPGLDSRAIGGGIIAPGNVLPDGRSYQFIDPVDLTDAEFDVTRLHDAPTAPRGLTYFATFKDRDRRLIAENPALRERVRTSEPSAWPGILADWYAAEAAKTVARIPCNADAEGYRAQALSDLAAAAAEFAALSDGRRTGLFQIACRVGKYVAHVHLSDAEFRAAFMEAARTNGALQKHGPQWAVKALRSALDKSRTDTRPPLARAFRSNGGQ
jgi:hypothetical protein